MLREGKREREKELFTGVYMRIITRDPQIRFFFYDSTRLHDHIIYYGTLYALNKKKKKNGEKKRKIRWGSTQVAMPSLAI